MTIDDMRYILKIAEQGSFTKAARALFITQPTLSQRLQKVENELGIRLFERNRFGEVTPTKAGRLFCAECGHILSHWQRLQEDLQDLKGRKNITMGIPVRTGYDTIAGLQDALAQEMPDVTISFVDCPNYQMEELITKGELDLALIRMPTAGSNFRMRLLFSNRPGVMLRKGSPLREKIYYHPGDPVPYISLAELETEPLVAAPASREHRTRLWLDTLFAQIPGLHPRVLYTVPNINMYEHYAKSGTASYILPLQKLRDGMCQLEPEFNLPYGNYLVQSEKADPEVADAVYRILMKRINPI